MTIKTLDKLKNVLIVRNIVSFITSIIDYPRNIGCLLFFNAKVLSYSVAVFFYKDVLPDGNTTNYHPNVFIFS